MSDEKLRELERRWKETGSVEDEAKYLLERVRLGDLSQERLELAAYCGHEAAVLALGKSPASFEGDLRRWVEGLRAWGEEPFSRAGLAAARLCLPTWEAERPGDARARHAIESYEAYLACPCESHERNVAYWQDPLRNPDRSVGEAYRLVVHENTFGSSVAKPAIAKELASWVLGPGKIALARHSAVPPRPRRWT